MTTQTAGYVKHIKVGRTTPADGPDGAKSEIARCISPLLDGLGWRGDPSLLRAALPHLPDEMGLIELMNTMANLKFEGRDFATRMSAIDSRMLPCLFVTTGGHARVLLARSEDGILCYDGRRGEYKQIPDRRLKGRAVLFRQMRLGGDSFLKPQRNWFSGILARFSGITALILLTSFIITALAMLSPVFIMTIYDKVLSAKSPEVMTAVGIGIAVYIIADIGFRLLRGRLLNFMSIRLGNIIGNEVLRRILFLPPAFTETANLGAQVSRIRDFETVREFLSGTSAATVFELPFLIVLVGGMFVIAGSLAWVPVGAIFLFAAFAIIILPFVREANGEAAQAGAERQAFVVEMLSNLRAVKLVGSVGLWQERFRTLSGESTMATYRSTAISSLVSGVSHVLVMGAGLATMAVGVTHVMAGTLTTGALIASMILVWRILAPLRTGLATLTQIGRIRKSIDQVDRLMNMGLEQQLDTHVTLSSELRGRVTFSNVSIRYSKDAPPALLGVNFNVEPGQTVVIVGHDGSGKSTILKLILGLYQPQAGRIMLDGLNVRQMDPVLLRHTVSYASQANHFFYGSVAQNLRLAAPDATDEDLQDAIWKAQVADDIAALPEGIETRIGDHNISQLSNSMRKRLNIARVFLRKPKLMLLDEPDAGLTEFEIGNLIATMQFIKGDGSIFIATHSSAFLDIADHAIWLEGGRVRMMGSGAEVKAQYNQDKARFSA